MSRTFRDVSGFTGRYDDEFMNSLKRGLISIPKAGEVFDEIWGQIGKKRRKRILTRKRRHELKLY